ncbi:hypothetical protein Pogu_2312 [Pyrobaculum oguniense TE7]|uniref:Uncharacterized protein n=1 Tax=Pyrobaculum oguniense (strain DSM 13380 / JCM 10595 / TE7) TaxID=698757 RepID=H6QBI8_PYROT|nr:hypothetical protein Pogu_2312 [Pyrobaculum oguniense TE7]
MELPKIAVKALLTLMLVVALVHADSWQNCVNNWVVNQGIYDSSGNYIKIDYGVCVQKS